MEAYSGRTRFGTFCFYLWGCLGMTGLSLSLQSIYKIPLDTTACALIGVLFFLGFCFLFRKKTLPIGAVILVLLLGGISIWRPSFWSALPHCFPVFFALLFQRFERSGMIVLFSIDSREILRGVSFANQELYQQAVLICILFFSGILFAFCVYYRQHPLILTLFCALLYLPYWTYQFAPSLFAGRLLLAFLLSSFAVRFFSPSDSLSPRKIKKKSSAFPFRVHREFEIPQRASAGFCAILLFLIFYIPGSFSNLMPRTPWVNYSNIVDAVLKIQVEIKNSSVRLPFHLDFSFGGGISGGKIGGAFHPQNIPVMDIESDSSAPIYLRAWIGHDYQYGRWSALTQADRENYTALFGENTFPESLSMQTLINDYGTDFLSDWLDFSSVRIRNIRTGGNLICFPSVAFYAQQEAERYDLEPWMDGIAYAGGQNLREADMTFQNAFPLYDEDFSTFLDWTSSESYRDEDYREYAKEQYLTVPNQMLEPLSDLAQKITAGIDDDYNRVVAIQNYLSEHYRYTTEPGDERQNDPVSYFLFESKSGYCAHYASAMVLLTRSLGIPARYVEGYVVPPQKDGTITVMDSNAHSWPEVYFSGIGWLPFEPTTGYGSSDTPPVQESSSSSMMPETSSAASLPAPSSSVFSPSASHGGTESAPRVSVTSHIKPWVIALIICTALFLSLVAALGACSLHFKRMHHFSSTDSLVIQKLAAFMILLLERLGIVRKNGELPSAFAARVDAQFRGKLRPSFQDCVALILKDRFGISPLKPEEIEQVFHCAEQLCALLSESVSPIKRLWYRKILHLLGPLR